MNHLDVSKAYAALHAKWPELKNSVMPDVPESDDAFWHRMFHAASYNRCLQEVFYRGIVVVESGSKSTPETRTTFDGSVVVVSVLNRDSITDVMPRVMKLPKVQP